MDTKSSQSSSLAHWFVFISIAALALALIGAGMVFMMAPLQEQKQVDLKERQKAELQRPLKDHITVGHVQSTIIRSLTNDRHYTHTYPFTAFVDPWGDNGYIGIFFGIKTLGGTDAVFLVSDQALKELDGLPYIKAVNGTAKEVESTLEYADERYSYSDVMRYLRTGEK